MSRLNIGIDLGTGNITIFIGGKGVVLSEATAISYDAYTDEVVAIGNEAKQMLDKTPETIELVMPIDSGTISDFSVMEQILSHYIKLICKRCVFRPNVIISTPSAITDLQKKTIVEVICSCGAGKVSLIDEPIASALGAGVKIDNPHGVMVVDIGAGTCDIAVITMGVVSVSSSLKIAGDDFNVAIEQYLKRERGIIIGLATAEKIKKAIGCAYQREEEFEMSINAKDAVTRLPKIFNITSSEIYLALKDSLELIFEEIKDIFEQCSPEICADILSDGIKLTGGSSLLYGLDKTIFNKLGIPVKLIADPMNTAAKGTGYAFKDFNKLEDNGYAFRSKEIVSDIV